MAGNKTEAYLMNAVRNDCINHIRKMQKRKCVNKLITNCLVAGSKEAV